MVYFACGDQRGELPRNFADWGKTELVHILDGACDRENVDPNVKNGRRGDLRATTDGVIAEALVPIYKAFGFRRIVCGHTHFNGENAGKLEPDHTRKEISDVYTVLSSSVEYSVYREKFLQERNEKKKSGDKISIEPETLRSLVLPVELPARCLVVTADLSDIGAKCSQKFFDSESAYNYFFELMKRTINTFTMKHKNDFFTPGNNAIKSLDRFFSDIPDKLENYCKKDEKNYDFYEQLLRDLVTLITKIVNNKQSDLYGFWSHSKGLIQIFKNIKKTGDWLLENLSNSTLKTDINMPAPVITPSSMATSSSNSR